LLTTICKLQNVGSRNIKADTIQGEGKEEGFDRFLSLQITDMAMLLSDR
jgi:hypothetical protein